MTTEDSQRLPQGERLPEGADVPPMNAAEIMTLLMLDQYRIKMGLDEGFEITEDHLQIAKASAEIAMAAAMCVMDMAKAEKVVNYALVADGDQQNPTAIVMVGAPDPKLVQAVQATYHAFNSLVRDTPKS